MTTKQKPNTKVNSNDAFAKLALVSALGAGVAWLANRYLDTVEADIARQNEALDKKGVGQPASQTSDNQSQNKNNDAGNSASSLKDSVTTSLTGMINKTLASQGKPEIQTLKPQEMKGTVVYTFEEFSFTNEAGVGYHVFDPNDVLASMAKDRGVFDTHYTLNRVRIKGIVSGVGNYGHMGRFERQLTVVPL